MKSIKKIPLEEHEFIFDLALEIRDLIGNDASECMNQALAGIRLSASDLQSNGSKEKKG